MKPKFQTIINKTKGDCLRAAIASMFELELIQVPHFMLFGRRWFIIMHAFVWAMGYEFTWQWHKHRQFSRKHLINGCIIASVPSRTYTHVTHVVLVNSVGRVIHDPNPNKKWLGENIVEKTKIEGWYYMKRRGSK